MRRRFRNGQAHSPPSACDQTSSLNVTRAFAAMGHASLFKCGAWPEESFFPSRLLAPLARFRFPTPWCWQILTTSVLPTTILLILRTSLKISRWSTRTRNIRSPLKRLNKHRRRWLELPRRRTPWSLSLLPRTRCHGTRGSTSGCCTSSSSRLCSVWR